jgi:hypothetical protein
MSGVMGEMLSDCAPWAADCAGGAGVDDGGAGVDLVSCGIRDFSFMSLETCCPDRTSGSGTLPGSRLCETVVILARHGNRKVGGRVARASRRERRSVGANIGGSMGINVALQKVS